jgi:predicted dehydrogenase
MAEKPLRLGVVGANPNVGWASRTHMPALLNLSEYEIDAVCTTKRESAEAAAQKYEANKAYSNFHDLVGDPQIDVVDVCVKVPYHHEIVMAALDAGKHVYCEWPLGATLAQATEMANLAAARGVRTMVGLQARAAPSFMRMRELIAEGWIGRVLSASLTQFQPGLLQPRASDAVWRADRANGAHTLSIAAGHTLDAFGFCVGPFEEVSAVVDTLAPEWQLEGGGTVKVTAPDYVSVTGRLVGGGNATVTVASVPHIGSGVRMEVYGTEGTLVATSGGQTQATGLQVKGARAGEELKEIDIPERLRWIPDTVPQGTPINVAQMFRRFAEGIRQGEPAEPTFEDAVRNHKLLDALERSSESGQAVKVER